ncbi:hypothetical protein SAMN05421753_12050 [Planctomicrobium piriforme]|uniref:Uncharacterized protein n=1 Tax=Planctomicrobium piriforme TaxID=1576369 RepID=A0A1I3RBV7_9PLAN|nr:hypothetical protein SAMN05421753_12050 [Planctomicrobium piriforme]
MRPGAGEQDKTFLGIRQFYDPQLDALIGRGVVRFLAVVSLIHIGDFRGCSGDLMNGCTIQKLEPVPVR